MIPKVFHFLWTGDNPLPKYFPTIIQSWKRWYPDWKIILWRSRNLHDLQNQRLYNKIHDLRGKSDIARYEILYQQGGVYMDADSLARGFFDFSVYSKCVACRERPYGNVPAMVVNGILAASPGDPFIKLLLDAVGNIVINKKFSAYHHTGPTLINVAPPPGAWIETLHSHPSK